INETRTQPASSTTATRASTRTAAHPQGGVVAVAQAGHALGRATGGAGTHGASQPSLWRVVPPDRPVYRKAAQATGGAVAAVAGCGAGEQSERTEELGGRNGARLRC